MIAWKVWHDMKWRLAFCLALQLLLAAFHVTMFNTLQDVRRRESEPPDRREELAREQAGDDFTNYLQFNYAHGSWGGFSVLVVILAAGGVMTRRRDGALLLSVPVRRATWVIGQAAVALGAAAVLALTENMVYVVATHAFAPHRALLRSLGDCLANTATIGVTLAATAWLRGSMRAGLAAAIGLCGIEFTMRGSLAGWSPARLSLPWVAPLPWRPLALVAALAAGGTLLAVHRFRRVDF